MLLVPAIDLKDGKCVRLRQGRMEDDTVFSDDPVAMAGHWVERGARRLHLVDLNGAFAGEPVNGDIIKAIARTFPDLPIQIGGGIRSLEIAKTYLDSGVHWIIVGTRAVREPAFVQELCGVFPGHVIVGLDARDGRVATDGWAEVTDIDVTAQALQFCDFGVSAIVYTDIGRDGMLQGVNVEATAALARAIDIPVIASGGITNLDDVRELCAVAHEGIEAAITGRAIYEGTLDFAQGQALADQLTKQA